MNLLHFGLYNKNEPQMGLRNGLRKLSGKYNEFSWVQRPKRAERDLETLIKHYNPDTVFMQIQTPGVINPSLLKKYTNIRFLNFCGDVVPVIPRWYFDVSPFCTNLFTNTDWAEQVPGARYMQVSCDLDIYKPQGRKIETKPVVFMGNNHGSRFPLSVLRSKMVERFKTKEWFQAYGRGWGTGVVDLNFKQQEEAAVYRSAKIGINLSHMDLGSYTSDRMFRVMASGCMCLAYRHKDIDKEFTEKAHIRTWDSLNELEALIEFYLHFGEKERADISENGCKLVHEKYSWEERLKTIL
jgi:hypothetical protein